MKTLLDLFGRISELPNNRTSGHFIVNDAPKFVLDKRANELAIPLHRIWLPRNNSGPVYYRYTAGFWKRDENLWFGVRDDRPTILPALNQRPPLCAEFTGSDRPDQVRRTYANYKHRVYTDAKFLHSASSKAYFPVDDVVQIFVNYFENALRTSS